MKWSQTYLFSHLLIILMVVSCSHETTVIPNDSVINWVEESLDSVSNNRALGLLQLGIVRYGADPIYKSFGDSISTIDGSLDKNTELPLTKTSKLFTGIIINSLVEDGILNLEDSVGMHLKNYLPDDVVKNIGSASIQNLLFHRSGLKDNKNMLSHDLYSEQNFMDDLQANQLSEERYGYRYSDLGYMVLGKIAEESSGMSSQDLLEKYVTEKYDLSNTKYIEGARDAFLQAADGMSSSIEDLFKLQQVHIQAYLKYIDRGEQHPLIQTERTSSTGINFLRYGNGMIQITSADRKYLGYYRSSENYSTVYLFSLYPDVGLILVTDKGGPWLGELARDLMDGLVDEGRIENPIKRSLAWTLFSIIGSDGLANAKTWFENNKESKKYNFAESEMNTVGYRLLRRGLIDESIEVFSLNVNEFPESSNVYDSLGEAYLESGNNEKAKENYQKSLDLDPFNSRAKRVLRRLEGQE